MVVKCVSVYSCCYNGFDSVGSESIYALCVQETVWILQILSEINVRSQKMSILTLESNVFMEWLSVQHRCSWRCSK